MTLGATTDSSPGTSYIPSKTWLSLTGTIFILLIIPIILEGLVNAFLQKSPEMVSHSDESMKNYSEDIKESE